MCFVNDPISFVLRFPIISNFSDFEYLKIWACEWWYLFESNQINAKISLWVFFSMEFLSYLVKRFVLLVSERRDTLTRINRLVCVCRQQRALLLYIFFIAVRTHEVWDIQIKKIDVKFLFSLFFRLSKMCRVFITPTWYGFTIGWLWLSIFVREQGEKKYDKIVGLFGDYLATGSLPLVPLRTPTTTTTTYYTFD